MCTCNLALSFWTFNKDLSFPFSKNQTAPAKSLVCLFEGRKGSPLSQDCTSKPSRKGDSRAKQQGASIPCYGSSLPAPLPQNNWNLNPAPRTPSLTPTTQSEGASVLALRQVEKQFAFWLRFLWSMKLEVGHPAGPRSLGAASPGSWGWWERRDGQVSFACLPSKTGAPNYNPGAPLHCCSGSCPPPRNSVATGPGVLSGVKK